MNAFFAHPPSGHSFTPRAGTHHGDAGQATSQPGLQHPEPPSGNIIWAREYPTTTDIKPPRSSEDIQARSESIIHCTEWPSIRLSSKLGVGSSSVELF
ncbi:hypothetical protein GE21DRAFT_2838 [Neurospora crassa]|uniref:Uncharacterized protein n=3 Tax=Neurospora TaxID=5140 RepID=V5IPQ8_NEUCR|nr:uncharacterized protein NEUTE1DRAFT_44003 [Neurospora tetrasperma FGSC 2508]XP_011393542.1 hypothetical protein NCU03418 [Neurospora crassa OR74A]EGZ70118.1 hypothetical protein NEUTE2DRAFT_68118 [Neurospora tetrasperma FGSC 2509]KHE86389.1 hypothetical protein GE21DRAFT_2838 [Neurospora crassa]EGO56980.1 hypothetical protein NEUTE1DRAFT_44003 [Neurospora tetrasperma FGSC 2508]ESA43504.1 hypothetical protein NCU03418 [Neurospora crassa OR74A]CAD21131.1 hypothetical protein [Neurospora cras|eukprot:XP_011393542.1 hypothetical protein NCU03418 [Neurospora crassa OR74A]